MILRQLPTPLDISWTCKPVESARWGLQLLDDGCVHCWIEHEVIRGVTPKMLVWWFKHLEGDLVYDGRRLPRYRVWHPRDHVSIAYSRRNLGYGTLAPLTGQRNNFP